MRIVSRNLTLLFPLFPFTVQFAASGLGMKSVAIRLTTPTLLKSMVEHARMVVLKAVASATKTDVPDKDDPAMMTFNQPETHPAPSLSSQARSLAGFSSSINLTTSKKPTQSNPDKEEAPRLQKAQSSALRLNSILHHRSPDKSTISKSDGLGIRKVRSVRWDTPAQLPKLNEALAPTPKKPRINEIRLRRSMKSVGRAHAGDADGAGPRNATFGEFSRHHLWGRDGRMANHPQPMQTVGRDAFGNMTDERGTNATFDLAAIAKKQNSSPSSVPKPSGLARSTTALEMFVLKKNTHK